MSESYDRRHSIDKYKENQKPKIYNIIHDRVCDFYDFFKVLPRFAPVTMDEYHLVEMAMDIICLCGSGANARKHRKPKPCYQINDKKILLIVLEDVAKDMNPDSKDAIQLIHRLN